MLDLFLCACAAIYVATDTQAYGTQVRIIAPVHSYLTHLDKAVNFSETMGWIPVTLSSHVAYSLQNAQLLPQ